MYIRKTNQLSCLHNWGQNLRPVVYVTDPIVNIKRYKFVRKSDLAL